MQFRFLLAGKSIQHDGSQHHHKSTSVVLGDDAHSELEDLDSRTDSDSFSDIVRARRTKRHKVDHRVLSKDGDSKVALVHVSGKNKRYAQDFFNTLIEVQWRYTLFVFFMSHLISWLIFALFWYLVAAAHGDLYGQHQEGALPCVINMNDFTACFMYSMESQTTIGYGTTYPSKECPEAVFLLGLQTTLGLIIQAATVGIVFSKMTRPRLRSQTLLFSRHAVVSLRDGWLTLQFRVGDIRKSHIVGGKLSVLLRRAKKTSEGDVYEMDQRQLDVHFDGSATVLHLMWPTLVIHRIDKKSPLYNMSPEDFRGEHFEILVFLEGIIQATGQTTLAQTSYAPSEVRWGKKFSPIIRFNKDLHRYEADYDRFHETTAAEAPYTSAYQMDRLRAYHMESPKKSEELLTTRDRHVQFMAWSSNPSPEGAKSLFPPMYTTVSPEMAEYDSGQFQGQK